MTGRLKDRVVIVTGAGAGIGRSSARAFAREGAIVVAAGARSASVEETVRLIAEDGGTADPVVADVTRPEDMDYVVRTTVERHGALHIAHNNAGVLGTVAPVGGLDHAAWRHVLDVNLNGMFHSMQPEIAHMRAHGGGVIVNTSSTLGRHVRRPGLSAYAASKAAVTALSRTAALDHIRDNVRINVVSPGPTDTRMARWEGESEADRAARLAATVPLARMGTTQEVVNAVLWLASDESSFVVGQDLVVDGGSTC
ncbi:glucose 1-dehydrogenase [Streptomyces sp. NPDC093516]|uniref:SDR family NAD(P)-dependent oxidoreductase n=1 Tax=Streptomyces sp. NPDC093516 TaxID=3155304 RepID=UPI0034461C6D